jgi:hypothetical protein
MEERLVDGRSPGRRSTRRGSFLPFGAAFALLLTVHGSTESISAARSFAGLHARHEGAARRPAHVAPADESARYRLPQGAALREDARDAITILDGSLAVRARTYSDGELFGEGIGEIRVGSRRTDGSAGAIYREDRSTVLFVTNTRIEIELRGHVFAMEVRKADGSPMALYLEPISRPTLPLHRVQDLAVLQ